MTIAEQLEREESRRRLAGAAAAASALLGLGGQLALQLVLQDAPTTSFTAAIADGVTRGIDPNPNIRAEQVAFFSDKSGLLILCAVAIAAAALLLWPALSYLYDATRFRRPETPGVARVMLGIGAFGLAIGVLGRQIFTSLGTSEFVDAADKSRDAVVDALRGGPVLGSLILAQAAALALAFAFVMISLNGMRAGLLTRFMGFLGVFVGFLIVIPLGSPLPVVQTFWLLALAALFFRLMPDTVPAAWKSGQAEPWPSMADQREPAAPVPAAEGAGGESEPAGGAHPSSKKRKRKRRA